MGSQSAGWYEDPESDQHWRYWDGSEWGIRKDRVAGPSESDGPPGYVNDAVASSPKKRRSDWKIAAVALAVALVLWLVVGAMWLYLEPSPTASAPARPPTQTTPAPPAAKPAPGPSLTTSQRNAVRKANDYLDVLAFSKSGLVSQLEYNGYSTADATYAVNSISVNWNEQAAKKAKSYLDVMAFSRSGLIEQLEYNGFTRAQAEYGVSKVGY